MRKALEKALSRPLVRGLMGLACVLLVSTSATAQGVTEPDPCAHAYGQRDLNVCWAREAERAERAMNEAYLALRQKLPRRAAKRLEKAQKLWREFRDAHVATLYGVESPTATWGLEYPMCLSISHTTLSRARTQQLERMLDQDDETICPL